MELIEKIKKHENLNVVFWLIKDSCWMLELRWLAMAMVIPTIIIGAYIVYITRKTNDVLINLAVLCWIAANSFWMIFDFLKYDGYKLITAIPFALGLICVILFYYKTIITKRNSN